MQYYIGIDVAKNDFYACFNENDNVFKFSNNEIGIGSFLDNLVERGYGKDKTMIGVESTGRYSLPLAIICSEQSYKIKVINSIITSKKTKSNIRGVKNDKIDAKTIRSCLMEGAGYLFSLDKESIVVKNLLRQRYLLVKMKSDIKRKQQDIRYKENYLNLAITNINDELYRFLEEKIKIIDDKLGQYCPDTQRLLQTIPAIGKITSACLLAEIGDINRFSGPDKLTAFIGIDPRTYESGISIKGKGYITKRGSKIVRKTLYNAALTSIKTPNIFQRFYLKKLSEGKPKKVCLVAVMRKMTHVVYSVWKNKKPFIDMNREDSLRKDLTLS